MTLEIHAQHNKNKSQCSCFSGMSLSFPSRYVNIILIANPNLSYVLNDVNFWNELVFCVLPRPINNLFAIYNKQLKYTFRSTCKNAELANLDLLRSWSSLLCCGVCTFNLYLGAISPCYQNNIFLYCIWHSRYFF